MTRQAPSLTALLLALILALTSVSMAVARGGMSLSGMMILCVNAGQVIVPIGPDGNPQDQPHLCPDCNMGALALTDPVPLVAPIRRAHPAQATPITQIVHAAPIRAARARGPPLSV